MLLFIRRQLRITNLADLHFEVLKHLDLDRLDYYHFSNLKKRLEERKLSSIEEAINTAGGCFAVQRKAIFPDELKRLE
jgi:hypothetical protein